jgi:hypothetical protein
LIISLIIQTIRRDRYGHVGIDEASNVGRPDPSGADQIDAEHQPTDLVVRIVDGQVPYVISRVRSESVLTVGSR